MSGSYNDTRLDKAGRYSSGSRQAQLLYFEHSVHGDLRPLFEDYFDTSVGSKRESASCVAIACAPGQEPSTILFLTDNPKEVRAARGASFSAIQIVRNGVAADPTLPEARTFGDICVL